MISKKSPKRYNNFQKRKNTPGAIASQRYLSFRIDSSLFSMQSLLTRLKSQRLPVVQCRLHSKVILPRAVIYYTLSSDASLGCLRSQKITQVLAQLSKHFSKTLLGVGEDTGNEVVE